MNAESQQRTVPAEGRASEEEQVDYVRRAAKIRRCQTDGRAAGAQLTKGGSAASGRRHVQPAAR